MDSLILEQNASKWIDSAKFMKGYMNSLRPEEMTAVDFLTEAWRTRKYDSELAREASEMCSILKDSDQFHNNNREIINHSRTLRSIAVTLYMKDEQTFKEMSDAIRAALKKKKERANHERVEKETDTSTNADGDPNPSSNPQDVFESPIRIKSIKFQAQNKGGNPQYEEIGPSGDESPIYPNVKYIASKIKFDILRPFDSLKLKIRIIRPNGKIIKGSDPNLDYSYDTFIFPHQSDSCSLRSFGTDSGRLYSEGIYRYEVLYGDQILISSPINIKPKKSLDGLGFFIKNVKLKNVDKSGNILSEYGTNEFPTTANYIRAEFDYVGGITAGRTEFVYRYYSPDGTLIRGNKSPAGATYAYTTDLYDNGHIILPGFGTSEGNFYRTTGEYRVEISAKNKIIYKGSFFIGQKVQPRPNPGPIPSPSPKPKPKQKSIKNYWFIVLGILAVIGVGLGTWFFINRDDDASAITMYTLGKTEIYNTDGTLIVEIADPSTPLKVLESNRDGYIVRTSDGKKGLVRNAELLDSTDHMALKKIINGNESIIDNNLQPIIYDFVKNNPEIEFPEDTTWIISNLPTHLSPNSVVLERLQPNYEKSPLTAVSFIVRSPNHDNFLAIYKIDSDGSFKKVSEENSKTGYLIKTLNHDAAKGKYMVGYNTNHKIVSPKDVDADFTITDATAESRNRDGQFISSKLSNKTVFASPQITYTTKTPGEKIDLKVKIFSPEQKLLYNSKTKEYSKYDVSFIPSGKTGKFTLRGWDLTADGTLPIEKYYTFEIWKDNKVEASYIVYTNK